MPQKLRTYRSFQKFFDKNNTLLNEAGYLEVDQKIDGPKSYPPGGPCLHEKWESQRFGTIVNYNDKAYYQNAYIDGLCHFNWLDPYACTFIYEPYVNSLNWKKLSTSNGAGLLQNLAELDDTVAMFGSKLVSSASYGGYKWGWAPLLSDVSAVADTINKCRVEPPGLPQKYVDTNTFTVERFFGLPTDKPRIKVTWYVTVKFDGVVTFDQDILSLYDFMGFHPSPKLAWDLVPLSFAVDWVLPIGDALDNMAGPKGWVQAVNFTGWRTIKALYAEETVNLRGDIASMQKASKCTLFQRHYLSCALETKTFKKDLGLKWPSFSNLMDYGYLANTFSKKRK